MEAPDPLHNMNISQVHMGASEGELPRGSLPDAPDETDDMQDTVPSSGKIHVETQVHSMPDITEYIPLGTLTLPAMFGVNHTWQELRNPHCFAGMRALNATILVSPYKLGMIRLWAKTHPRERGQVIVRVYALPADHPTHVFLHGVSEMRSIVQLVDVSREAWQAENDDQLPLTSQLPEKAKDVSLYHTFNNLPSPTPVLSETLGRYTRLAMEGILHPNGYVSGLQTCLYPYQRRSAALMIQREEAPDQIADYTLEEFTAPDSSKYYLQRLKGKVYRHCRKFEGCKGGILAETMGLGKTLICLAVVLATKHHWPQIPIEYSLLTRPTVGSLVEMAASAAGRYGIPWMYFFKYLEDTKAEHYTGCIKALQDNIGTYNIQPPASQHFLRSLVTPEVRTIRLSTGTIIVCPPNLLEQWKSEIAKHLEPGSLRVLILDENKAGLPGVDELLTYDLLLFSRTMFDRVGKEAALSAKSRSVLHNIHWKRIIVDEGHSMGNARTISGGLAKDLLAERRWIVSGTPVNELIGIEVELETLESTSTEPSTIERDEVEKILETRKSGVVGPNERNSLTKLGTIVKNFLKVKPWSILSETEEWVTWIKVVLNKETSTPRLDPCLQALMKDLFIKHRPEDVDKDVQLPHLSNRIVYLEPSYHDKLSLNLFTVTLISNAVTSERTDQDYMFHPKNYQSLKELVNNLRGSCFFWCGFSRDDVLQTIRNNKAFLSKKDGTGRPEDAVLLSAAIKHAEKALASSSWDFFRYYHELGCFVENFPQKYKHVWAMQRDMMDPFLISLTMLGTAQRTVNHQLYCSDPCVGLQSAGELARDLANSRAAEGKGGNRTQHNVLIPKPLSATTKTSESTIYGGTQQPSASGLTAQVPGGTPSGASAPLKSALKRPLAAASDFQVPPDSPLALARLIGTASSKLSYLLDQIMLYQSQEKILCFYEGDYIAYYISQALDICGVHHLIYTSKLIRHQRSQYVVTFNSSETFRVLLMDVRQAAYGLNLYSASRVYFVNPIWQPSVEAQAIKRAHRIGQTKPVYVETLVLRNTIEDKMLQRRKAMTFHEHEVAKDVLEDKTMETIIQEMEFLPITPEEEGSPHAQMARLRTPLQIFGRPGFNAMVSENPDAARVEFGTRPPLTLRPIKKTKKTTTAVVPGDPQGDS